jgi:hypothetical protein
MVCVTTQKVATSSHQSYASPHYFASAPAPDVPLPDNTALPDRDLIFLYAVMHQHRRTFEAGLMRPGRIFNYAVAEALRAEIARRWPYGRYA